MASGMIQDASDPGASVAMVAALDDVRAIVLAAAAGLGVDLPWSDQEENGAITPCMDANGSPTERAYTRFGMEATPSRPRDWETILRRAAATWSESGFDVSRRDYDENYSAVFATANGYDAKATVNRAERRVFIGASSPCLPMDGA